MELKYFKGGRYTQYEIIEYTVKKRGQYITTCVINARLLMAGIKTFPCGNGDDLKLTPEQRIEVLEFLQVERKKITDSYPVKTFEGWHKSGLPTFEDYCFPGDKVDVAVVEHFLNSVPPVTLQPGFVQAGEAFSDEPDEAGRMRPTYTTFTVINGEKDGNGDNLWLFNGCCFKGQTNNRVNRKTQLEEALDEAWQEVKMNICVG